MNLLYRYIIFLFPERKEESRDRKMRATINERIEKLSEMAGQKEGKRWE